LSFPQNLPKVANLPSLCFVSQIAILNYMGYTGRYFPNNLKKFRRMNGYKQEFVMEYLGLNSTNRISRWEKGLAMPSVINLLKLSVLYNTLVDQLYSEHIYEIKRNLKDKQKLLVSSHLKKTKDKIK
jgi:transcriptional regulator with XRE-family HTH domain